MDFLYTSVTILYTGFALTAILLFLLKLVFRQRIPLWTRFLELSACILLFAGCCGALVFFRDIAHLFSGDQVASYTDVYPVRGPYWYTYWLITLLSCAAPQVYWFKKMRKSFAVALWMLPLLFAGTIVSLLLALYSQQHYRDARPSAWVFYRPQVADLLLPLLVFGALLVLLYFITGKKSRNALAAGKSLKEPE